MYSIDIVDELIFRRLSYTLFSLPQPIFGLKNEFANSVSIIRSSSPQDMTWRRQRREEKGYFWRITCWRFCSTDWLSWFANRLIVIEAYPDPSD